MRYLEVAVLPIYDKPSDTWSVLRFYTDLDDQVSMTVDDTGWSEKVDGYPDDDQIREAMLPYLRHVKRTGNDELGLVRLVTGPSKLMPNVTKQVSMRWDFEIEQRADGIYVIGFRRGPQAEWLNPLDAPKEVQQYMVLYSATYPETYQDGRMDIPWGSIDEMVQATDMPRTDEELILASFVNESPEAEARWYPDIYPGKRRGAVWPELPANSRSLRRYKYPKAEASRMLEAFERGDKRATLRHGLGRPDRPRHVTIAR